MSDRKNGDVPRRRYGGQRRLAAPFIFVLLAALLQGAVAGAQDAPPQIIITGTNSSGLPEIELRAYGRDGQGGPLNLATQTLMVTHAGKLAESVAVIGTHPVGTLTVFLVDLPPGVSEQLDAIQDVIETHAAAPTMVEQVDEIAIFRVGDAGAEQLLEPTAFYNGVRNFFANPLPETEGLTALFDSTVGLLDNVNALKSRRDMVAHLVIISDGTDAISSAFIAEDVPARAGTLGIPVHTIWLDNANLSQAGKDIGRSYLRDVATETGGVAATLTDSGQLSALRDRITAFRDHVVIHYTVDELAGGSFPVSLSLADRPEIIANTTVDVPPGAPLIQIDVPEESRQLSLPSVDEPVTLSFTTSRSWLDGTERTPLRAQLLVNGAVQEIDVGDLDRFEATVTNLVFGVNTIRVAMVDDNGGQATSPPLLLTVSEGPRSIPPELSAGGFLPSLGDGFPWLICLVVLAALGGLLLLAMWWFRIRLPGLEHIRDRLPVGQGPDPYDGTRAEMAANGRVGEPAVATALPYLDVVRAETRLPAQLALAGVEMRLGRSPLNADIVFEHDPTVSRLHASIIRDGYEYRLYDEQSTSGTLVNGIAVPAHGVALIDGDEIHLGAVHLRFRQP